MALLPAALASIQETSVGVSDACLLDPLSEDSFLENLKARYYRHQIYTYIGSVVVSVNPYEQLPLYTKDIIFEYRSRNMYELPPHIYAISDEAYRSMRDRELDQCVIISGESGAGKTEASKVVMQYVAAVSGKGKEVERVKEQLLQSNPVLEAFGNAKTLRNDNSSRFGKYMDMEFDFKGDPLGGVITNYLLEKCRVVGQAEGERNFHIFYQLLAGADITFLKSLKLRRNCENYYYLNQSGCVQVQTIDDKKAFDTTMNAMAVIGFYEDEVTAVFQLISAVLKIGTASFKHSNNIDGTDGCRILGHEELYEVCDLLQCESRTLINALTKRTVEAHTDRVRTDLSAQEAVFARDALCKAIYSRLFTWIVQRINDSIRVKGSLKRKVMGVLDIYGFEIFEKNSFEQFIINYCNEKLQQIFIELTLKEEQEEYIKEGIEWIHVEYFNNAVICELIEKTNVGILAMLDEECLRPGTVTDLTFLDKLNRTCHHHKHYESRGCRKGQSDKTLPHNAFRLQHYAGSVTYYVEGFIEKNNDLLFRDLSQAMYKCEHPLLKTLFPEGNMSRKSFKRPATAGSQFKSSVGELMRNLLCKSPNYIRCIKPNDFKSPRKFDDELVRHQVRYLGLMENVRVRRAGYVFRQKYPLFLFRYKMLGTATWPSWSGRPRDGVVEILQSQGYSQEAYALGRTKVFIRNPQTLLQLEERRRDRMHDLAVVVQKMWRGWHQRQIYLRIRAAQILLSAQWRSYSAWRHYERVKWATLVLCSYTRGWQARRLAARLRYEKLCLWAVGIIRKFFYGWQARKLAAQLRHEKLVLWAVGVIRKYFMGWQVRKEYRKMFRKVAGPKISRFMQVALKVQYLENLRYRLPSMSPLDSNWPPCSPLYLQTNRILREIFHRWRCNKYRARFDDSSRKQMEEKVAASDIFREKKSVYPKTVSVPFKGDYVRIRQNEKWKKVCLVSNDQHVMFADIVQKVNRKNGKMVPHLFVLSTQAMLILDQRSMVVKYRIPLSDIRSMHLSPFQDKIVFFHLSQQVPPENGAPNNGDFVNKKGDFVMSTEHVVEVVAKTCLQALNIGESRPEVHITPQFTAEFAQRNVDVVFKMGVPEVPPGTVKIVRKSNKLEVLQP